jgi:hypothetical protein
LSWYDVIIVAALSLGAFGVGGFVSGLAGSLAGPPVSAISVFQADEGVPAATNNLDMVDGILGALRDQIAAEYVSSVGAGGKTGGNDKKQDELRAAASAMVGQESQDQVALADATDRADAAQSRQLSERHWAEIAIRVASSVVCYALLAGLIFLVAARSGMPAARGPVLGYSLVLLLAFLVADVATWVAGLFLLLLVVTFVIRDRGRQAAGD